MSTINPEYDDAKDMPLMFQSYGAASAGKSEAVGTFLRKLYFTNIQMTARFRRLLLANGIVDPSPYEWLDGEAWYRGEPIENRQSDGEQAAINEMRRAILTKGERNQE